MNTRVGWALSIGAQSLLLLLWVAYGWAGALVWLVFTVPMSGATYVLTRGKW